MAKPASLLGQGQLLRWPNMLALGAALATSPGTTEPSSAGSQRSSWSAPGPATQPSATLMWPPCTLKTRPVMSFDSRAPEPHDQRRDVVRVVGVELVGLLRSFEAPEVLGHAGEGSRGDGVDGDSVATELPGGDHGHCRDAGFGGAVVGLADVAVDTRRGSRVDDPGVVGLTGLRAVAPVLDRRPRRERRFLAGGRG